MKKSVKMGISLMALVIVFIALAFWSAGLRAQQPIQVGSDDDGAAEAALNAQSANSDGDGDGEINFNRSAKATVSTLTLTMTPMPLEGNATPIP